MAEYSKFYLTNNGQALLAKMIAGTGDIEFTKVCASSTQYTESQLIALTALTNIKQTSLISKVTRTNEVSIKVEAAYSNRDLTAGYYMRTLGLYAKDPDKGEVLYGVTIETSGNCYMPPYNGITVSAAYIQLYTTVGNASNVSLEVSPGAFATIGDIQELEKEIADLKAYIGYTDSDIYGVEVDFKNKKFTRLAGSANFTPGAMFDDITCFGGRKRVNLTDGGVEVAEFGDAAYTETGKLTQTVVKNGVSYPVGTAVQVMVRQPKFYYKVVPLVLEKIKYPQMEEVVVTGAATADGTITVTIENVSKTADITSGMSASAIADAISKLGFSNFQSRRTGVTVRFVSRISGMRGKMTVSFGSTGSTGTVKSYSEELAKGFHMRKGRYYVSDTEKAGFKLHPTFVQDGKEKEVVYRAAYEPCIFDVSANAYNMTDEQNGDFTATTGDKLSSVAGAKPCSGKTQNLTRNNARTMAANRGAGWSQSYTISASATEMLMLIEYASFNMQKAIGVGNVNRAWLEDGINWSENTGATAALGNASGAVTIVVPGQTAGTTQNIVMVTYRGEENPYGNIWKHEDGINVMPKWKHDFYIADHSFADAKADGAYVKVGFPMAFTEGYISAFGFDEDFDYLFIASETNGDSSLPVGDYTYSNVAPPDWHIVVVGGGWNYGVGAGVLFRYSSDAVGDRTRDISGGRLVYVPQEAA